MPACAHAAVSGSTANVYVRSDTKSVRNPVVAQFLADHHVEQNKFADWAAADAFFTSHGFHIARKLAAPGGPRRRRETWTMTAA
jgi:hypothetical protein